MNIDLAYWQRISPYFKPQEIYSPASLQHCSHLIDIGFLKKINHLRAKIGKPIIINNWASTRVKIQDRIENAGVRTQNDNKKLGGASNSMHCTGRAFDIKIRGLTGIEIYNLVLETNFVFEGLGIYKSFVHLDCRANLTNKQNKNIKLWTKNY